VEKNHPQIWNPFVLDQEFVSCEKGKPINPYAILLFEIMATLINFWSYDRNLISFASQKDSHFFNKITSIRGAEIGIGISDKENRSFHKEAMNSGIKRN
jgi:hypothetical protein